MKKTVLIICLLLVPQIASAGIYERITDSSENGNKIAVHTFMAALREWARGSVTKQQVIDAFGLDETDQTDIQAIADEFTGKSTAVEKASYLTKIHDVFLLSEAGFYTKTKAKTELGF